MFVKSAPPSSTGGLVSVAAAPPSPNANEFAAFDGCPDAAAGTASTDAQASNSVRRILICPSCM